MPRQLDKTFIDTINQHFGIAHKICRVYFQNSDERKDVLQEMMYQLWRSYPSFDARSTFSTWMYKVCLNTALTWKRNSKKYRNETLALGHYEIADDTPANKEEAIKQLTNAISEMAPLNKAVVLLYLESMSYEEIAAILGISRANVSVRLVRIKKELETKLKQKQN